MEKKEFKQIVRICNTDLDGSRHIFMELQKIKGISFMFSCAVCRANNINLFKKTGELSDEEISKIEETIKNPEGKLPSWLFNRRRDPETGKDIHLISADLDFTKDSDIKKMKMIKCYRGIRHMFGLPVRGQRTKSNFRKNKGKVKLGVQRRPGAKKGKT